MDDILKELDKLDALLKEKGYDGMWMTDAGYPGHLKDSVKAYLRESLFGNENGLQKDFSLFTYIKWTDDESPRISCYLKVRCNAGLKFEVTKMELTHKDRYSQTIREEELQIPSNKLIPTLDQAVKMVQEPSLRIKRKPRLGI